MSEPGSLIRSRTGRSAAPNFHSFVINELGLGIVTGKFPTGSILPRDAELMDMYGVSRTVLREALKTLEAKGMVEARPKVGTRVAPKNRWAYFDQQVLLWLFEGGFDGPLVAHFFSIRKLIESEAVKLACRNRTADHVRTMYYWIQQMSISRGVSESFALANLELHQIFLTASQNPLMRAALGVVEFTLAAAMPKAEVTDGTSVYYETSIMVQRGLVHAVETGDEAAAREHLLHILKLEEATAIEALG
jgi:DNA-binding FadR family transcriptional regulator